MISAESDIGDFYENLYKHDICLNLVKNTGQFTLRLELLLMATLNDHRGAVFG